MNTSDHLSVPFRGIQYSHSVANFFTDKNNMPKNDTWHARLDQIVYYGMDWLCPGYSQVLHAHGKTERGAGLGFCVPGTTAAFGLGLLTEQKKLIVVLDDSGRQRPPRMSKWGSRGEKGVGKQQKKHKPVSTFSGSRKKQVAKRGRVKKYRHTPGSSSLVAGRRLLLR